MSFFDDFLKSFNISELKNEIAISMIIGIGVMIIGEIKVKNFSEEEIVLISKRCEYKVIGSGLKLKSMARGEIVIEGDVIGFVRSN